MKILTVSHLFPNHITPNKGVFVKERVKYIAKKIDLSIVAPIPYFPFNYLLGQYKNFNKIRDEEIFDHLPVKHPKFLAIPKLAKSADGILYYWSLNKYFSNLISTHQFDLLDFHWVYPDSYAGIKWAQTFNKKIIVTIRGNESIYYFEKNSRKKIAIKCLHSVDHIISVSNDLKNKVVKDYGLDPQNVTVIPNGIDLNKFYKIDRTAAQKMCNLDTNKKYIITISRLSHEKGIEHLIRAFAKLNAKNTILIIIGDGPLRNKLQSLSHDLKISTSVKFLGFIPHEDTNKWYNAADIFCLPSLWEGCPNVVIESLACGTPVVSTQVGGIPDLVPSKYYGLLVKPGEPNELADAFDYALSEKWDRSAISAFGRKNSWENVADRVIQVYKKVLK